GRYRCVVIECGERPARLLRRRGQASEESGDPEAHAAFVGERDFRCPRHRRERKHGSCRPDERFPATPRRSEGLAIAWFHYRPPCRPLRHSFEPNQNLSRALGATMQIGTTSVSATESV